MENSHHIGVLLNRIKLSRKNSLHKIVRKVTSFLYSDPYFANPTTAFLRYSIPLGLSRDALINKIVTHHNNRKRYDLSLAALWTYHQKQRTNFNLQKKAARLGGLSGIKNFIGWHNFLGTDTLSIHPNLYKIARQLEKKKSKPLRLSSLNSKDLYLFPFELEEGQHVYLLYPYKLKKKDGFTAMPTYILKPRKQNRSKKAAIVISLRAVAS